MPGFTDVLEDDVLNVYFRGQNRVLTGVGNYVALYTASPGENTAGTEVGSGIGYSRQAVTWGSPSGGTISNTSEIIFGPFTSSVNIVAVGITNSGSIGGGQLFAFGAVSPPKAVNAGESLRIPAGQLTVTLD